MRNVFQKILATITTPAQLPVGKNQEAAMPTLETVNSETNSNKENEMFAKIKAMFKETAMEKETLKKETVMEAVHKKENDMNNPVVIDETCPAPAKVAAWGVALGAACNETCAQVFVDFDADTVAPALEACSSTYINLTDAMGGVTTIYDVAAKKAAAKAANRAAAELDWAIHLARVASFRARSPKTNGGGSALIRSRKAHAAKKAAGRRAAMARRIARVKAAQFEAARARLEWFFATLSTAFVATLKPAFRQIFRVNRSIRRAQRATAKRAARLAAVQAAHVKWVAENPASVATQTPEAKAKRLAVEAEKAAKAAAEKKAAADRKAAWLARQAKKQEVAPAPRLSAEEARAAKAARRAAEKKVTKKKGVISVSLVAPTAKPAAKKAMVTVTKPAKPAKPAAKKAAAKPAAKAAAVRMLPGVSLPKALRKKVAAIFAPDPVTVVATKPAPVAKVEAPKPAPAPKPALTEEDVDLLVETLFDSELTANDELAHLAQETIAREIRKQRDIERLEQVDCLFADPDSAQLAQLAKAGIVPVAATGEIVTLAERYAVLYEHRGDEVEPGTIAQVICGGWKNGDGVIMRAKVRVGGNQ